MSDRRLRELDRVLAVEGTVEATVRWAMVAHDAGLLSYLRCRKCHGCPSCTPPVSACQSCSGTGRAPLSDSVVVGSAVGDEACATLAGWRPVAKRARTATLVEAAVLTLGSLVPHDVLPPTWRDRATILAETFPEALRRLVVALAEAHLGRKPTGPRERVVDLLRVWAAEPCPVRARKRYLAYTEDSKRINAAWLPHSDLPAALGYTVKWQAEAMRATEVEEVLRRELVPWLLGRADPLRERLEERGSDEQNGLPDRGSTTTARRRG